MTQPLAKICGCHMEPVTNDATQQSDLCSEATGSHNGRGWVIDYCPLHAAAPKMRQELAHDALLFDRLANRLLNLDDPEDCADLQARCAETRALLAKIEGGK